MYGWVWTDEKWRKRDEEWMKVDDGKRKGERNKTDREGRERDTFPRVWKECVKGKKWCGLKFRDKTNERCRKKEGGVGWFQRERELQSKERGGGEWEEGREVEKEAKGVFKREKNGQRYEAREIEREKEGKKGMKHCMILRCRWLQRETLMTRDSPFSHESPGRERAIEREWKRKREREGFFLQRAGEH